MGRADAEALERERAGDGPSWSCPLVVVPLTASAPLAAPAAADAGGGETVATAVAMFDFAAANQRPSQNR